MISDPAFQFNSLLSQSKNVLILLPQNPESEILASGWALYFFLKKKSIHSEIAFEDEYDEMARVSFLPTPEGIKHSLRGIQDFVLSFNTQSHKIMDVRTEKLDGEMRIYITPEKGGIDPRDFSFIPSQFKYDLVITLGAPDKESLGKIFEENPDIFYEIPVVNIDNHIGNENFGKINLINFTASSVSEILFEVIEKTNPDFVDKTIAECLLAGIISATESFQKTNATPKALQFAAQLIEKGADQQKISRYMYKNQPLHLLKLWGRVMVKLHWEEEQKLIWAVLNIEDFVQSRSTPLDIPQVLEKVKDNYSAGKIFAVFYNEKNNSTVANIKTVAPETLEKLKNIFGGVIKRNILVFRVENQEAVIAASQTLEKIKEIQ